MSGPAFHTISSAPRGGEVILLADRAGRRVTGFWARSCAGEGWFTIDATRDPPMQRVPFDPTHWADGA